MTLQEFDFYRIYAYNMFDYLQSRILTMTRHCELMIDMYDLVTNTFALTRFPNRIFLFLGSIIDDYGTVPTTFNNKLVYTKTAIMVTLAHELFHVEHKLSITDYASNKEYADEVEIIIDQQVKQFIKEHKKEIVFKFGINIDMGYLDNYSFTDYDEGEFHYIKNGYQRCTVKDYYHQVIINVILRSLDSFYKLDVFTDDNKFKDIEIIFNKKDNVLIKSGGVYLFDNVPAFCNLAYSYAGYYDRYKVLVDVAVDPGYRDKAYVNFSFSNSLVFPLVFQQTE